MTKQIEIQNEINRLNAYLDYLNNADYSPEIKKLKREDTEKRIEIQQLELAKLIDVEFEEL